MTLVVVFALLGLLTLGFPLFLVLFGISGALYQDTHGLNLLSMTISFQKLQGQDFIAAIPLFTFAGYLLARSRSPERIVNLFTAAFSWLRGADAAIVIGIMALFTALTGASGIGILALGGLMLPLLLKSGKNEDFSLGLITSSGSIGLLFAPSLPVIIFALIASQNNYPVEINALFKAALVPSFILIGAVTVFAIFRGRRKDAPLPPVFSWIALRKALWAARFEVPLPVLVYGGIYSGVFTVMEAAIVTAAYVYLMEFFLYRDLSMKTHFLDVVAESLKLSGGIFVIIATAFIFTNWLVNEQIPSKAFEVLAPILKNKWLFLAAANVFLLLAGSLLDVFAAILIMLPILLPIAAEFGVHPYHFAIVFLINIELGYLIPPMGLNLFISSFRFKRPITELYKVSFPFIVIMAGVLLLMTYVPALSTFTLSQASKDHVAKGKAVSRLEKPTVERNDKGEVFLAFPAVEGAKSYEVVFLEEPPKTLEDFDMGTPIPNTAGPSAKGVVLRVPLVGLPAKGSLHFAVRTVDAKENTGSWASSEVLNLP